MGKLVIFGKHIMVYEIRPLHSVGQNFSGRFGLAKLPPRVAYTRLVAFCPFETTLPLPGDTLGYSAARVGTLVQQQHLEQQQQQAAEEAGSSSKLFLQNLAG